MNEQTHRYKNTVGMQVKENTIQHQPVPIRPYSLKEISRMYGMSACTINRWLQPFKEQVGERNGRYYTNQQVEKIFLLLGTPNIPGEDKDFY
jgi:hypothetical protein